MPKTNRCLKMAPHEDIGMDGLERVGNQDSLLNYARKSIGLLLGVSLLFGALGAGGVVWAKSKLKFQTQLPAAIRANSSFVFRGKVEDNDDLDEVLFCFRKPGDTLYRCTRMTLYSGVRYRITLPSYQVRSPGIEFHIKAIDVDKKVHELYATNKKPATLKVSAKATPATTNAVKKSDDSDPDEDKAEAGEEEGKVYTAARKEQRIQTAPAVVSVLTAADIQANGWRSLLEILRNIVGLDINHNGHWPDIGIRGVNPRVSYGDKIIVLLDGHNMSWRQFNRNYLNASWISVDNIKRIEVIRGPGSALWGANALSGVINIITKTSQDLKGLSGTIGGSPLSQSNFITLQGGQELLNGVTFRGSFSLSNTNRTPLLAPIKEFLQSSPSVKYIPQGDRVYSQNFYAQLTWRGFSLSFHQSRHDPNAPFSTYSILGGDDSRFITDRYFSKLSWATLLGSWGTLFLWTSVDNYAHTPDAVYEGNPLTASPSLVKMSASDFRYEAGGQLSAQLVKGLSMNLGFDFEYLNLVRLHFPEVWKASNIETPRFTNAHISGFAQFQYNLNNIIELTLGGRFDYDQVYQGIFTPRAAAVITPGLGFFIKLLYGNAFKAPSFHDLYYYRKDAFYGNPDTKPESVHTAEAQIGWHRRGLMAISLNGYFSAFQNLIAYLEKKAGVPLSNPDSFPSSQHPDPTKSYRQKGNSAALYTYGGEMEFRIFPVRSLHIRGSIGLFLGNKGDENFQPQDYAAWLTGGLSISYAFKIGPIQFQIAAGGLLVSPKKVPARAFNIGESYVEDTNGNRVKVPSWTTAQDTTLETPWYVNTYITLQALRLFKSVDIVLRLNNVANTDLYDAGRELLYPQEKFDFMAWLRVHY